jgi:hypothetical protein
LAAGVALATGAKTAWAQEDAMGEQQPATVDSRGPVNGSVRRIGLGGAFVALADDTEGVAINPASSAVRLPYSWSDWDTSFGIDFAIGAWLPKNDVYNQEGSDAEPAAEQDVQESTALFGSAALLVNYRHLGLGISAEAQRNAASAQDRMQGFDTSLAANFGTVHVNLAYGFVDGQLLLGAGPRLIGMSFGGSGSSGGGLLGTGGIGYEAGIIVKPIAAQYRVAAAVKSPVNAKVPGEAGLTAHVPWEVALGAAYQFGKRPLNPPLITAKQLARQQTSDGEPSKAAIAQAEHDLFESYLKRQRWYLLVSGELSVSEGGGPVGLSGLTAMDRPVISPRLGLESEVIPHHLRLRAGSYYEPALIAGTRSRVHGTGGFDVRLFEWSVFGLMEPFDYWQLSIGADAARSYLNTGFSIGFWH